jgi:hypothetical protein
MRIRMGLAAAMGLLFSGWCASANAAVPALIPVQGVLADTQGALVSGAHTLTFALYGAATDGTVVFTEDHPVTMTGGSFLVELGSQQLLDLNLFGADGGIWVEVTIDGAETISPRFRLGTVPYAAWAQHAHDATMLGGHDSAYFAVGSHTHSGAELETALESTSLGALLGVTCASAGTLLVWDGAGFVCQQVTGAQILDGSIGHEDLALSAVESANIAPDTITAEDIAANAVGNSEMADNAIGSAEMADNAIGSAEIVNGSIVSADIAADTITAANIAANAVNSSEIVDGAVANAEMADNAIGSAEIVNGSIVSGDIAADTITAGNIAQDAVGSSEIADNAFTYVQVGNTWDVPGDTDTGVPNGQGFCALTRMELAAGVTPSCAVYKGTTNWILHTPSTGTWCVAGCIRW